VSPKRVPPSAEWGLDAIGTGPARDPTDAAERLKAAARSLGFDPVGITSAQLPPLEADRLHTWIGQERHGEMAYMARADRDRSDATTLLEGARSVLMVALVYPPTSETEPPQAGRTRVSTYAQAPYDYHRVLGARLQLLVDFVAELIPDATARRFCDTAPLLERAFARHAGLGFVGKNTNLINRSRGSFFFLGGIALDVDLPTDSADGVGSCGTCTRCLQACPTDAFPAPFELDARRCISYLTIEHRGAYPKELRKHVGAHTFGCDICQAVCPWNQKFAPDGDPELAADPTRHEPVILELYRRARDGFKSLARGTPWERTGKRGFLRNLATVMGNEGNPAYGPALAELEANPDSGVSEHAAWAREQLP
jgi:epoxyqueuosine reductase